MQRKLRFLTGLGLGTLLILTGLRADDFDADYQAVVAARGRQSETERLHALFKVDWAYTMAIYPEWATWVGYPGGETRWDDLSREAIMRRKALAGRGLPVLATIDRTQLGPVDRVSYDIFLRQGEEEREGTRFPGELLQVSQLGGVQQDPVALLTDMPADTAEQIEHKLARLKGLPVQVDAVISLLQEGLARGITPPQITLQGVPQQVRNLIPAEPRQSPLMAPFLNLPPGVSGERGLAQQAAAIEVYTATVRPAYQRLERFLRETYLPGARTTIAVTALPDGAAWYAHLIRSHTTTDLTAQQIHDIGLAEVKRIRAEMERVMRESGFAGTLPEFFQYLRTDPKFFFTDKDALLHAYRDIAKRADPELMKLFKTLPRTPYGVVPVPAYMEKEQTTAYYRSGSPDANRPGNFYANTYALETRPKWEMVPLTLHEAVPGHHLQIALAQEMPELPTFRREGGYTAFVEGWGLYAESLGEEMGMYTDPYDRFGQLTYEMWRAVRLVVDTGMHALGWSRQEAIAYFKANSSKSDHDIEVEIDRYIVWPGQALAYKLGELKFKELRAYATRELGDRFDVRLFHDELLRNGAVPLSVLDTHIREWVAAQKQGG